MIAETLRRAAGANGAPLPDHARVHGTITAGELRAAADIVDALVDALNDAMRSSRKDFKAGADGDRQHREAYSGQFQALERAS